MNLIQMKRAEKLAGLFLLALAVFAGLTFVSTAIKQGWFDKKFYFSTRVENGEGIFPGTLVQMAGLRVGSVSDVELGANGEVNVRFYVLEKFRNKLRIDSELVVTRPYILGDKVLDLSVGSPAKILMAENALIPSKDTFDLLAAFNNKNVGAVAEKLTQLFRSSEFLLEALTKKKRIESFVTVIDRLDPLTSNLNKMSTEVSVLSRQISKDNGAANLVVALNQFSSEINTIIPEMRKANPRMAEDLAKTVGNLNSVIGQLEPAVREVGPSLPQAAKELFSVLTETTVTLRAMQKSFLLKSNVEEVLEEKNRLPASTIDSGK